MPDDLEAELEVETTPETEPDITEPEPEKASPPLTAADIATAVATAIAPRAQPMTAEQQEQEWLRLEAESGQTRQQLIFNDNARRQANLRDNLPIYERAGAADAKDELGERVDLLPEVQALMAKYPENVRANSQAWKDAAYLVLGKHARDKKPTGKADEGGEKPGKVVGGAGGKVNSGLSEGRGAAVGGKGGSKKQYSEFEQKVIDKTCHGDTFEARAAEYEKYKDRDSTKPREVKNEGSNRADLALQSLTRGARI